MTFWTMPMWLAPSGFAGYTYYRMRCTDYSKSWWWRVRELELYPELSFGGTVLNTGTAFASSNRSGELPDEAFDGNTSNWWGADNGNGSNNIGEYVGIQLTDPAIVLSARYRVQGGGHSADAIVLEGSNDDVTYTTIASITDPTTASNTWASFNFI